MDIRKVKKLIELLESSGISEIEIHEGEESVRISRQVSGPAQAIVQTPAGVSVVQAGGGTGAARPAEELEAPAETGHVVKAPIVGIFYSSSSPETPPFVEVGQAIEAGDVLCIIEAMKIMNQIESDVSGVVSRILVENGEPVEYGQPLFFITLESPGQER